MAAIALGEIEDPEAIDPLVEVFEREEGIRAAVIWALGEIANRGSRKARRARNAAFDEWGRAPWRNDPEKTGLTPATQCFGSEFLFPCPPRGAPDPVIGA